MYLLDSGLPVKGLLGPSSAAIACFEVVAWRWKSSSPPPLPYSLFTAGFSSFQWAKYGFAAAILPSPLDSVLTRFALRSSSLNSRFVMADMFVFDREYTW